MRISWLLGVAAVGLMVAGCVTAKQGFYYKDGLRADAKPALLSSLDRDKTICNGRAAEASMGSGGYGVVKAQMIQYSFEGCMAEKGWEVRPK